MQRCGTGLSTLVSNGLYTLLFIADSTLHHKILPFGHFISLTCLCLGLPYDLTSKHVICDVNDIHDNDDVPYSFHVMQPIKLYKNYLSQDPQHNTESCRKVMLQKRSQFASSFKAGAQIPQTAVSGASKHPD